MYPEFDKQHIENSYQEAKKAYATLGVDTDQVLAAAVAIPISLHCWQVDDVAGFEIKPEGLDGGGIMATGNQLGRARNGDEARCDLNEVLRLLPGKYKLNIHASYAETDGKVVDRDVLEPAHFAKWIAWAKEQGVGLDFNTTFYAHPKVADGMSLSHPDPEIRAFWIRHGKVCRKIAEHIGRELHQPCILNHWLPDGMKDLPADRWSPRQRLKESLDEILSADQGIDTSLCVDAVESKLFGLGSEEYVVGSFEFYTCYALSRKFRLCLDMGHFHPTETIHDKISSLLQFLDALLLHISRPIRWDSDHVVLFNDDVRAVFHELARGKAMEKTAVALDFFDASINRIAAYVIGARATRKAMLYAMLEPVDMLQQLEREGKGGQKLAMMEEMKSMPFGAVWNMLCTREDTPAGMAWLRDIERYEQDVLAARK